MTHVALFRGINVGRAKRVAMADLRRVMEELGFERVRTLLNSGNVVFDAGRGQSAAAGDAAGRIERAVVDSTGVSSRVTVITSKDLDVVVDENPVPDAADPSRLFVAFPREPDALA